MKDTIHVTSEIGKLRTVLLHRPGKEIENFTPTMMSRLLFDETPYLPVAQKEHDQFASVLRKHGVKVLYIEKLAAEAFIHGGPVVKRRFVKELVHESGYSTGMVYHALYDYLITLNNQDLINQAIAGIRKRDLKTLPSDIVDMTLPNSDGFFMDPMPNLYFTRDPSACIGNGLSINHMTFPARQRESLLNELIVKHHPLFKGKHIPIWRNRDQASHIEGGDEQVLSKSVIAIGISQRTTTRAIFGMAQNLFSHTNFKKIITIQIPHNHAMMHLDTVFTMVNYDQFTVYPGILNMNHQINIWTLTPNPNNHLGFDVHYSNDLYRTLKSALGLSELDLIPTGNGDPLVADREQWNDGSNTLAIAPGVVVTYDRNYVSNHALERHGLKVITISSSELSRGRGGPRCMSCPIFREDI